MDLRTWRKAQRKTLADIALVLGISGKNPSRTVQRYELGISAPDVVMAARIALMTNGNVSFQDLCRTRQNYLVQARSTVPAGAAA